MLRIMLSRFSSLWGFGTRRSLRDATSTGSLPIAALLAVMSVVFCSTASAQTAYFSGTQTVLPNSLSYISQDAVAVDASGNVYVSDSSGAVYEMEAVNGILPAAPVTRTLGSGFISPTDLAVDAHGDVFVADIGSGLVQEIVAVDGVIPASPTIRTLNTGSYTHPYGVAVDVSGDVFVANLDAPSTVYEIVAVDGVIPSTPTINPLGGAYAFDNPTRLAVDASGNVYVADELNSAVEEITAASGYATVKTLGSGFLHPEGVVVDANGNVYVADSGNSQVKEIIAINGVIPSTPTIKILGSGLSAPMGVALDARDDLFVADNSLGEVLELQQSGGNFGQVNVGAASATITTTFTEITGGVLGTPAVLTQGTTGLDFAIASGGTCSGTNPGAGKTCTVNVTFTPQYPGTRYGAVLLKNSSGTPIATGYIQGVGVSPQVSFLPATATTLGSGFATPGGLAIDAHGDVFVANTNNAQVEEILAGSGQSPLASGVFSLPTGVADRRIPEIHVEIGDRRWRVGLASAETGDQHRRLLEVFRSFFRGQDQAYRAVVDQAVVQQPQRRGDEPRRLMIVDAERRAHHGVRIERTMIADRHRHLGELPRRGAVQFHMPAKHHGVRRARGREAPRIPGPRAFVAAVIHPAGAADIGVHQGGVVAVTGGDGGCCLDDAHSGHAAVAGQCQRPARIET